MKTMSMDERRKYQRFQVKEKTSFVMNPEWPASGELVDIGNGGLAFNYASDHEWACSEDNNGMIFGSHDSCLTDMPMRVVADWPMAKENGESRPGIRRRCLKFGVLSDEQKFLLECFIWINGVCEC